MSVTAWSLSNTTALSTFSARIANYGMGTVFTVSSTGSKLAHAVFDASDSVRVLDVISGKETTFKVTEELTTALAFTLDGQILATGAGYADGAIKLWDTQNQLIGSLEGHRSWVSCLKMLPDGVTLASASADRTVRLWNLKTRQLIRTLRGQHGELWTLDASQDGRWLASGCKDGSVTLWDLASSTNRPPLYRTMPPNQVEWWNFSPDGLMIAALRKGRLFLHQTDAPDQISEPNLGMTNIQGFAFAPDSPRLAAVDANSSMTLWDCVNRRILTNLPLHLALDGQFLDGGRHLWTSAKDGVVTEWDSTTWQQTRSFKLTPGMSIYANCDKSGLVAAANYMGQFELFTVQAPEKRRAFHAQTRLAAVEFSPDGKTLAAASENGTVELWDTASITRTAMLRGVLLGYHSVVFSPDGSRLAAGSNGREAMKLWDVPSLEEVATLEGRGSFFSDVRFSPDGNTIGARNWNGLLHFWTAPSWSEIAAAERKLQAESP
jgi:WD40 repeat protein